MNSVEAMDLIDEDHLTGSEDDDDDDNPSSPGSAYDDGNLINVAMENEVTAQLVAAGVVGVAAAAAITSSKKKKRPHSFETNPSIRKRQQNRLLRKLRVSTVGSTVSGRIIQTHGALKMYFKRVFLSKTVLRPCVST